MGLPRSNDVYFVFLAMALASRITVLDEVFVNYRQSGTSLQANNARTPLDWYTAMKALKDKLIELNLYEEVELSFRNLVFGVGIYNLCSLKTAESFGEVYNKIRQEFLEEFDLKNFKEEEECYSYNRQKYEIYLKVKKYDLNEYLFMELQEMKLWKVRAQKAEKELEKLKTSTTLKTGKALLYIPNKIKKFLENK